MIGNVTRKSFPDIGSRPWTSSPNVAGALPVEKKRSASEPAFRVLALPEWPELEENRFPYLLISALAMPIDRSPLISSRASGE
ncbi:hypothetical protein [Burkholderia savannae]|uniref:hypothetical protein n=1 Tax=Burkholderia TaxID=32008 RepID=UPI00374430D5